MRLNSDIWLSMQNDDPTNEKQGGENGAHQADRRQDRRLAGKAVAAEAVEARAQERKDRAAKALRDNLLRRKQQVRARRSGAADEAFGLPAVKKDESDA